MARRARVSRAETLREDLVAIADELLDEAGDAVEGVATVCQAVNVLRRVRFAAATDRGEATAVLRVAHG